MDPATDLGALDLVAVVAALAAILALVSFHVFLSILKGILGHVWLVGAQIAGAVDRWTTDAMRTLGSFLDSSLHGLAEFIWFTTVGWWTILYHAVGGIVDAKGWAVNAYDRAVAAESHAIAYAEAAFATAEADINSMASSITSDLAGEIDQAVTAAAAATAAVAAIEAHLPDQVLSEAAALFGQAEQFTINQVTAAEQAAIAGLNGLQGQVSGLAGEIAGLTSPALDLLNPVLQQLLGLANGHADVAAQAAAAAAAAGVAAQVLPQVAAITAEVDQCVTPLCDTVTPNAKGLGDLGGLLGLLAEDAVLAALAALLVEAVADPEAAARQSVDAFGWMETLGTEAVNVVFGAAGVVF